MIWLITGIPVISAKHIHWPASFWQLQERPVIKSGKVGFKKVISKGTGFGTELVNLLVKQLDGTLKVESNNSTHISLQFKHSKLHH